VRVRYLIRDRDVKYPAPFDQALVDAGIEVVLIGIRMLRMNALMKRWVHGDRHRCDPLGQPAPTDTRIVPALPRACGRVARLR
jgi:hypothetical protein